ncbi:AAA family ATPase [Spartinivicinus ruber]|uniref:AAA family ATPase n=1 Tax=Spartinivicinus ruber TaxID=2683272 RepID=UPI0013D3DA46|nr:AAA family ATPase [Spartinivicinus ruber]
MSNISSKKIELDSSILAAGKVGHCWLVGPFPKHKPYCDYLFYFAYHFADQVHVVVASNTELKRVNQQYPFTYVHLATSASQVSVVIETEEGSPRSKQFFLVFKETDWLLASGLGMVPLPVELALSYPELLQAYTEQKKSVQPSYQTTSRAIENDDQLIGSKVAIIGPESAGKSTLAGGLAQTLKLPLVNEYARLWLEHRGNVGCYEDIGLIAKVQLAIEQTIVNQADSFLLDTGIMSIQIWSEVLFGQAPEWLVKLVQQHHYDLVLLVSPDLPWQFDSQRCQPTQAEREKFFQLCEALLTQLNIEYQIIAGNKRLEQAQRVLMGKFTHSFN